MFERFTKDARAVVERAVGEAERTGAATIDAEHLLVALADPAAPRGRGVGPFGRRGEAGDSAASARVAALLADAGLDPESLRAALDAEEAASLDAVGIDATEFGDLQPRRRFGHTRFGASAKQALERGVKLAVGHGEKRFDSRFILLGVLAADRGRVPRTLELAGVDRAELRAAVS